MSQVQDKWSLSPFTGWNERLPVLNSFRFGLLITLIAYACIFSMFLLVTDGIPYVLDNNETFSSIIHAKNMLLFGVGETFGLTDESYGMTAQSSPYVYTHQGNFPRFFALLIYLFGAQTVEAQIMVTTFTVGTAAVAMAYAVVARRAGPTIGLVLCLLLMTDFVMVAQWQVVTWRVWHLFFFFLGLYMVERAADSDAAEPFQWRLLLFIVVSHIALFYYEIMFAAFCAATTGIYALWRLKWRIRLIFWFGIAQTLGLAIGAFILVAQLVSYLGWDGFFTDMRLTMIARNVGANAALRQEIIDFMTDNRIVFWFNFNTLGDLRQFDTFIDTFVYRTLGVYSPGLVAIAIAGIAGIMLRRIVLNARVSRLLNRLPYGPVALAKGLIMSGFLLFGAVTVAGMNVPGIEMPDRLPRAGLLVVAFGLALSLSERVSSSCPSGRASMATVVPSLLSIAVVIGLQSVIAAPMADLGSVWLSSISGLGPLAVQVMLLVSGYAAMRLVLFGAEHAWYVDLLRRLSSLLSIGAAGLIAFSIAWIISPGYVVTGYLERYAPFNVFANLVCLAVGFTGVVLVAVNDSDLTFKAKNFARRVGIGSGASRPVVRTVVTSSRSLSFVLAILIAAMPAALPVQWLLVQTAYLDRLTIDLGVAFQTLADPRFSEKTIVANNYAAPMAVQTGAWAYYDPAFGSARVDTAEELPTIERDLRYLWLADRDENSVYREPEYFVCFFLQNLVAAMTHLQPPGGNCRGLKIVSGEVPQGPGIPRTIRVAEDPTGLDRWAVIHLDWDETDKEAPPATDREHAGPQ